MSTKLLFTIALISLFSVSGCGGGDDSSGGSGTASIYQGDWLIEYDNSTVTQTVSVDKNGVVTFVDTISCTFPASNPIVKITGNTFAYTGFESLNCDNGCSYVESSTATLNANNMRGTFMSTETCTGNTASTSTGTFTGTKL